MDEPQHLNTVIRARAGYWLNYTWKQGHLKEAWVLNIMINYGLIREDKSHLNKNNTGLHAAREGRGLMHDCTFIFEKHILKVPIHIWQNTSRSIQLIFWSFESYMIFISRCRLPVVMELYIPFLSTLNVLLYNLYTFLYNINYSWVNKQHSNKKREQKKKSILFIQILTQIKT